MDSTRLLFSHVLIIIGSIFLLVFPCSCNAHELKPYGIDAMYIFGASNLDGGNSIQQIPQAYHARFPYGLTIHKATGRASDGLLTCDYLAKSADLPLAEAYLNPNVTQFRGGVNFAFAGATVLSAEALAQRNLSIPYGNNSFAVQLQWMDAYVKRFCHDARDCRRKLKSALFMISFGGNDFSNAWWRGKTFEDIKKNLVPDVSQVFSDGIRKLIKYGATRLLIPGYSRLGCVPGTLSGAEKNNATVYDEFGCVKNVNDFYKDLNDLLKEALEKLRKEHPNVHIIYGDSFNAFKWILAHHKKLGVKYPLSACCGIGGKYNNTGGLKYLCGAPGIPFCSDPQEHIWWDGGHLTQNTNLYLSRFLVRDIQRSSLKIAA